MQNEQKIFDCVKYDSIWEVEKAAEFSVMVPTVLDTEEIEQISLIDKKLVDIRYPNNIVYRTAKGTKDISGDYNQYDKTDTYDLDRFTVTVRGFYHLILLATWTDNTYTYSIHTPYGVSRNSLDDLIMSLSAVNSIADTTHSVSLANPIVEYSYLFEAEYAIGYSIMIPAILTTSKIEHIYVISGKVVQIDYPNDIVYRMAKDTEDISGIYHQYPYTECFDVEHEIGLFHVTARGNKNLYYVAIWKTEEFTWSLYCPHGIHKCAVEKLIKSLRVTDSLTLGENQTIPKTLCGGFSKYRAVTTEDLEVFTKAMENHVGVRLEPLLVSTQIVAGKNYRFICNAEAVVLYPKPYLALVDIFCPLPSATSTEPVIKNIKKLC